MSIIKKSSLLCCALALTTSAFAATSTAVSTANSTAGASGKDTTAEVSQALGVQPSQFKSCSAFTENATDKKALLICLQQFNSKLTSKQLDSALSGYHHKSTVMPAAKPVSKQDVAVGKTSVTQARTATSEQLSDTTAKNLTDGDSSSSAKKETTQQQQPSNPDAGLPIATTQSPSINSTESTS